MALVIPGVARVSARWVLGGLEEAVNSFHFRYVGDFLGQGSANALGGLVRDFYNSCLPHITGAAVLTNIKAYDISTTPASVFDVAFTPLTATPGGGPAPFQLTSVISWRSNTAGRSGRGRTYMPPPPVNSLVNNGVAGAGGRPSAAPALITAFNAAADAMVAAAATAGTPMVIAASRPTPRAIGITSARVGDIYDTQRRRRAGQTESYTS